MPRTRIKICGITRPEDATLAAELGADAIGLNFIGGSRKITSSQAAAILVAIDHERFDEPIPKFRHAPTPVALCLAPNESSYREIWPTEFGRSISRFQIYGVDTQNLLNRLSSERAPYSFWLAVRVATFEEVSNIVDLVENTSWPVDAVVIDAAAPGQLGGSGKTFDWSWIERARNENANFCDLMPPLILAGGLTPDNVADAIRIARPYAVDVSSGVELPGHPGIKDPARLRAFIAAVRSTDSL